MYVPGRVFSGMSAALFSRVLRDMRRETAYVRWSGPAPMPNSLRGLDVMICDALLDSPHDLFDGRVELQAQLVDVSVGEQTHAHDVSGCRSEDLFRHFDLEAWRAHCLDYFLADAGNLRQQ